MKPIILFIVYSLVFTTQALPNVHRAITNAQLGVADALLEKFATDKRSLHLERREDGILVYKVSMKRVDGHTVRLRVTGYDGTDEVYIVTYRIIYENKYYSVEEYKRQKQIDAQTKQ